MMLHVGPRRYYGLIKTDFEKRYNSPLCVEIKPNYICAEIGAYLGAFAIRLAEMCKKVYAFEPSPDNIKFMEQNIALSGMNNIIIAPYAVSDCSGTSFMFGTKRQVFSLVPGLGRKEIPVKTITLDEYFANKDIDFIRLQINGAEAMALNGGKETLKRCKKICVNVDDRTKSKRDVIEITMILTKNFKNVFYKYGHLWGEK